MKKEVLIVSSCPLRGGAIGVIGELLKELSCLNKSEYSFSLFDTNNNRYENHKREDYHVDFYYRLQTNLKDRIIQHVPWVRSRYYKYKYIKAFKRLLSTKRYNAVLFFPVIFFSDKLIDIAHQHNTRVIFYPWGSEILRCEGWKMNHLMRAFLNVDYVVGSFNANTIKASKEIFNVQGYKIKEKKPFVSGVLMLDSIKEKYSRKQMSDILHIPESSFNVVCSYNGYATHNHEAIIKAIAQNKANLPTNYQLLFPLTYGSAPGYIDSIFSKCREEGLNAIFLTEFLSGEQMACLHYLTDLFIEIQPTDTGNAFLIEAIYAKNEIITGRWLHYDQFEKFGLPYHLIDAIEELPLKISEVVSRKVPKPVIPEQLINMFSIPTSEDRRIFWGDLFA